jgi:1,4-alpha-glucan branching enzyme
MNSQTITPGRSQTAVSTKTPQNPRNLSTRSNTRPGAQPSDGRKEALFEFNGGSAKEVLLAGDFTGWEKTPIRLRKGENGAWQAKVMLQPGQYHYKFVVDGQWKDDPAAKASRPNPFGTCNSIRDIS